MSKKKDFEGSFLYGLFSYVLWFFLSNFYFIICNLLFILFLASFGGNYNPINLLLMYISLIPMGPAVIALLASMGKVTRDKDISMTRYYFKAYRDNFKQAILIWTIGLTLIFVLTIDLYYFFKQTYGGYFVGIVIVLIVLILFTVINSFVLLSRFFVNTKELLKTGLLYSIKRLNVTIFDLVILFLGGVLIRYLATYAVFFVFSLTAYLIMFYNKKVVDEIEEQYKKSTDK